MRVAIYSRVSTDGQEKEGTSLETQEAACVQFAEQAGWVCADLIRDVASGYSLERPGLERLRAGIRAREFDLVLAYAVDRLSRHQNHIGVLLDEAENCGVQLEFVTERLEDNAVGRFILSARAFSAEVEREKIAERTLRGKAARARSGRIPQATGAGIYGYVYDPESGTRRIHPDQAAVVGRIFQDFAEGASISGIARSLNRELTPSFGGGRWYPVTVWRMLRNESYTGRTIYRRTQAVRIRDPLTGKKRRRVTERAETEWIEVPDATPKIVEPELFTRVQTILDLPERKQRGHPSQRYILSGRTRCARCGSAVVGQTLQRGRYSYYRCRNSYTSNVGTKCDSAYIRKALIEDAIREELVDLLTDPDRIAGEARRYFSNETQQDIAAESRETLRRIDEKQTRLVDLYVDGQLTKEIYEVRAAELRKQRHALESRVDLSPEPTALDPALLTEHLPLLAEHVRQWAYNATGEDFALLARALDLRVVASPERAQVTVSVPIVESVQNLNLVTIERTSA